MVFGMNDRLRTRIAAGGTIAALGVLASVALASNSGSSSDQQVSKATIPPPQVKTVIERRTVHVRRKAEDAPATAATAAAPAPAPAAAPAPAPAAAAPPAPVVRVSQSSDEDEHETGDDQNRGRDHGGGDDDHGDD